MVGVTIFVGLLVQVLQKGAAHTTKSFRSFHSKRKASKLLKSRKIHVKGTENTVSDDMSDGESLFDNYYGYNSEDQDSSRLVVVDDEAIVSAMERVITKESSRKMLFDVINNTKVVDSPKSIRRYPSLKEMEEMIEPAMHSAFERLLSKDNLLVQSVVHKAADNQIESPSSSCVLKKASTDEANTDK